MNTSSGAIYTIPRVAMIDNTGPNQIELNLNKSKIGIACGVSFTGWTKTGTLTIEYTCTNR